MAQERFKKPTTEQLIHFAVMFNNGKMEEEKIASMTAMCNLIIDRLHENGDVLIPTKEEDLINSFPESDEISDEDLQAASDFYDRIKEIPSSKLQPQNPIKRSLSSIITEEDWDDILNIEKICDPELGRDPETFRSRAQLLREYIDNYKTFKDWCKAIALHDHGEEDCKDWEEDYFDNFRTYLGWSIDEEENEAYYKS